MCVCICFTHSCDENERNLKWEKEENKNIESGEIEKREKHVEGERKRDLLKYR